MSVNYGERERTNIPALFFCIASVLIFFGFFGYTFFNASIYRIINGVDDCGNICGMENAKLSLPYCGKNDKRMDALTLVNITKDAINPNITHIHSRCVKDCEDFPGFKKVINRCYLIKANGTNGQEEAEGFTDFFSAVSEDLSNSWVSILISCFVALVFSYILLILFRYAIKYVIWIIFGSMIILLLAASIFIFGFYTSALNDGRNEDAIRFLVAAGMLLMVAIVIGSLLFFFRKRIGLVIQLFKEASKALSDVPLLVLEPVLTFLALAFTCVGFLYVVVIFASSGTFNVQNDAVGNFEKATYEKDDAMSLTLILNFIAFLWFTSFILGCQHFVVASSISQWFFTRTKDKLMSPISRGFSLLLRFHLGSVCFGSLMITFVKIVRMIFLLIKIGCRKRRRRGCEGICFKSRPRSDYCCQATIESLEELMQYLTRNAYIIVAKDGTSFFESGKRAFHLLIKNLMDVIVLNKVGDFILLIGRVFVALISGFVGYELVSRNQNITYPAVPITLCVIFAFLIVHCFMTVYEMTLDTIFICFCQDCEENDGNSRPYYMSNGMMKVMREMKPAAGGEFFGLGQNVETGTIMILQPYPQQYTQPHLQTYSQPYPQAYSQPDQPTYQQLDQPGHLQQPYQDQPYPPQTYHQPPPYQTPYNNQQYHQPNQMPYPPQPYQQPFPLPYQPPHYDKQQEVISEPDLNLKH